MPVLKFTYFYENRSKLIKGIKISHFISEVPINRMFYTICDVWRLATSKRFSHTAEFFLNLFFTAILSSSFDSNTDYMAFFHSKHILLISTINNRHVEGMLDYYIWLL